MIKTIKKLPLFIFFVPILMTLIFTSDRFSEIDFFYLTVGIFSVWILLFIVKYSEIIKRWAGVKR